MPRLARPSLNQLTWMETKRSACAWLAKRTRSRRKSLLSLSRVIATSKPAAHEAAAPAAGRCRASGPSRSGRPASRVPSSLPPWPGSSTIRRTATGKRRAARRVGTAPAAASSMSDSRASPRSAATVPAAKRRRGRSAARWVPEGRDSEPAGAGRKRRRATRSPRRRAPSVASAARPNESQRVTGGRR